MEIVKNSEEVAPLYRVTKVHKGSPARKGHTWILFDIDRGAKSQAVAFQVPSETNVEQRNFLVNKFLEHLNGTAQTDTNE